MDDAALDATALRLGYAVLVPLVVGAALVWLVWPPVHAVVAAALSGYAALLLAFLGAIHWGAGFAGAAAPRRLYLWGVVPPLVAWIALLMPPASGLVIHGAMQIVCYLVDRRVYPRRGMARWLTLRFRQSGIAALAAFLGAAGA